MSIDKTANRIASKQTLVLKSVIGCISLRRDTLSKLLVHNRTFLLLAQIVVCFEWMS
jgi:hypothetical protein